MAHQIGPRLAAIDRVAGFDAVAGIVIVARFENLFGTLTFRAI